MLMLGVSVPVAAFATDGDEPGPGYRFVDITFNTFNEDVTFVENGETTLTVTTTDDQTAYAIPAVNCENGYEVTGWSTSYGATVTDTVDASQAYWDESNYWGTGTMSVTAILEKVGPVVENKDVVVYFTTDDGETLLEHPVNVPVTSDGGVETVALADLESALADYLAQKGYALAEGNNDPQTVTDGSVNLMVNKISNTQKSVEITFAIDDTNNHGTFAAGQTYLNWSWTDMNETITSAPEVICDEGYKLVGWRVQGDTTTYLSAGAFGIDPYLAYFGDNDENEVGYMTIYPVFDKVEAPAKSVEVTFAIDTNDAHGTFVNGQTYLNWKWDDMNETITSQPEVICDEGYKLVGWRIQGDTTSYLSVEGFGVDPYLAYFGENDENSVGYMTIYPVFEAIETPAPAKSVEISFAIDSTDAHGTFVNGQTYLNWKWDDMNEIITSQPEVICDEGYELVGWRIQGDTTTFLTVEGYGIDPYLAYFGENDENTVGYMTVYPVFAKIDTDVIMNIQFWDNDTGEVVAGGDYWIPMDEDGIQNYSILQQYVPEGYEMLTGGDFFVVEGGHLDVTVQKIQRDVIMNIRFVTRDGTFVAGGDYFLPEGVQNYTILEQYLSEGYKLAETGDFMVEEGGQLDVVVEKISTDVKMNIQFKDGDQVIAGGDYFVPAGVQNYSVLKELGYVPEGYEMTVSGDFMAEEDAHLEVNIQKVSESSEIIMNIQFKDGDEVVGGGDYFVPAGVQNYSVLEKYVPVGYRMTVSGDFMAEEGAHLDVNVEKISTDVIMNIRFVTRDGTFVAGGDYFLPEGVQNLSILEDLVPTGYRMTETGDFMVEAGTSRDVTIELIPTEVIMNIQFWDNDSDEVVAGGDYFVPVDEDGIQNYSILQQYVPEGYEMLTGGDFFVVEGGHLDVTVQKIQRDVIMNIRFVLADGTFIAGGDYFLPEGIQNMSILVQYVPAGYKMMESGDFFVTEGGQEDITVELTPAPSEEPTPAPSEEPTPAPSEEPTPAPSEEPTPAPSEQPTAEPTAAPTAQPETPADNNDDNTTTVTSDNSDDVVKSDTPADNTAKVLPQTGVESSAPVIGFAFVLLAALGGAAAYLFVVRKKLN